MSKKLPKRDLMMIAATLAHERDIVANQVLLHTFSCAKEGVVRNLTARVRRLNSCLRIIEAAH